MLMQPACTGPIESDLEALDSVIRSIVASNRFYLLALGVEPVVDRGFPEDKS
jgi:hypothetical protein